MAVAAFDYFLKTYGGKYPKAADKLVRDRDALLAFYDLPAEHWIHLRTTNPIESTFATVRHRTARTKNCVSRATFLGLAFKLVQEAEKSWCRIRGMEASMSCSPAPSSGTASQHPPMTPNSSGSPLINPCRQHHVKKRGQRRRDGPKRQQKPCPIQFHLHLLFQGRFLMAASSAASAESGTASTPPARGKRSVPG